MDREDATADEAWQRYGRALIAAMREVLEETDSTDRELMLEVADYWLALGLMIGLEHADNGRKLLAAVETHAGERSVLLSDAQEFLTDAVQ